MTRDVHFGGDANMLEETLRSERSFLGSWLYAEDGMSLFWKDGEFKGLDSRDDVSVLVFGAFACVFEMETLDLRTG